MSEEDTASEPGRQPAVAQVVVMAPDDHGLVGMRTRPFQNADDVLGLDARAGRSSILAVRVQPLISRVAA